MNESTKTKKALRGSLFALFLCIVLLIGTTFAWFTDTASTGVNKIQSGNLKVGLQYKNAEQTAYKTATGKDAEDKFFKDNVLWEPGHVEYVNLKVSNNGSLAFNYKMYLKLWSDTPKTNANGDSVRLSQFLKYAVVDGEKTYSADDNGRIRALEDAQQAGSTTIRESLNADNLAKAKEGLLYAQGKAPSGGTDSEIVTLIVYMPETVGNEANMERSTKVLESGLGVTVNATQATVESDSFDDQYDKNASDTTTEVISFGSGHRDITGTIHAKGGFGALQVTDNATATVDADICGIESKNGDVTAAMAVWAKDSASVVINGGNFSQKITGTDDQYDLIYASQNATITINGGTFKCATPKWTLNCKDGSNAKIIVKGGKFYKFDPSNANTGTNEIFVADGYKVVQDGDWYKVVAESGN